MPEKAVTATARSASTRTGHMVAMQIRPYALEANHRSCGLATVRPLPQLLPFHANVDDMPAYLRDTTPEGLTDNPVALDETG